MTLHTPRNRFRGSRARPGTVLRGGESVSSVTAVTGLRRISKDGYVSVQVLIPGAVDNAHPPGTDLLDDAVVGERLADHGITRAKVVTIL